MWHYRRDRATSALSPAKETEEGYLYVDGFAVVPGILRYPRADGTVVRELILPEDIHDPASVDSLRRKPITWEHPPRRVDSQNVDAYGIGNLDDTGRGPDGELKVQFLIQKADYVEKFKRGDKRGLSPGYMCQLDDTPGVHPVYGEYDRRQHSRRYNHLAIVSNPRGGPRASARFDADDFVLEEEVDPEQIKKIVLEALKQQRADEATEQGRQDAESAAALAPVAKALGVEADSAKVLAAVEALAAKADSANDAALLAYASERAPLLNLASEHKIDAAEVAKLGNADLRKRCALAVLPTARKDASDEYYRAVIEVVSAKADGSVETIVQPEKPASSVAKNDSKDEILTPRQILQRQQAEARKNLGKE